MKAKMQASAISHFETGTRKPSFDNLRNLADALDVTTDYLLGRVSEFKDLAGADRLHRHYEALDGSDRKMADTVFASRKRPIYKTDWFGGKRKIEISEDVIGLGRYGKTLTVLYDIDVHDADEEEDEESLIESWTPSFKR